MPATFRCTHCQQEKPVNPKLKGQQKYCGEIACQCARKAAWQRNRKATDPEYCQSQKEAVRQWQQNKPGHQYQKQYRIDHQDYVKKNREQQRHRNQKRVRNQSSDSMIVKMDALTIDKSNLYLMTPVAENDTEKIVKMDTLLVQLQPYQESTIVASHGST
jgi:hypothetical protein